LEGKLEFRVYYYMFDSYERELYSACAAVQQLPHVRRGAVIEQQVARGGEMLWFHSVTVGGSVLCIRNKYHILWKVVNYFLKDKLRKFFKFYTKLL
jgi:hypothetical protein